MSNVEAAPVEQDMCSADAAIDTVPESELLSPREVPLGGPRAMRVRRALPNRDRRMVGAWCFVDSYGPDDISGRDGMQVPPHPHTGLQTVSWLLDGEILHHDSVGSTQLIRPGGLGLMTAGAGIAHSEQSPPEHSAVLHGAQLWVALPEPSRGVAPSFEFHDDLPRHVIDRNTITVILGELAGAVSPASTYSPLLGAAITLADGTLPLPLEPNFEHAVLALTPGVTVQDRTVPVGSMLYLGRDRSSLALTAEQPAQALLLGGEPFTEDLVMWWNFIGRSHDEIVEARDRWEAERDTDNAARRFGSVYGYEGPALPAPALPTTRLRARGRYRRHS